MRSIFGNGRTSLRRWEGIEEATGLVDYWPELGDSDEHPRAKLDKINHHLDFMGNGGSKWSKEKQQMERMLARVGERDGKVRMLLLHPDCDVCLDTSKKQMEDASALPRRITASLLELEKMRPRFPHLEIKLYEHAPFFRLTFIDRKTAIVGHYQKYWKDSIQSPLLVLEDKQRGNDWSFYVAFIRYFKAEWEQGRPMMAAELDKLAEKHGLA
jgi:hypothetical protein